MIWNTASNEERLRLWKNLRKEITGLELSEQLLHIAKFCSSIPYGSRSLDYYSPAEWPTPWEILFHGSFCTSSISLLMYYTLVMVDPSIDIELMLVEDNDGMYLLPLIENQFVLNYELSKVSKHSEISELYKIVQQFTKSQIKDIS